MINTYDVEESHNKPFLIAKVNSMSEDGGEKLFHTLEAAYNAFMADPKLSLALRVCSSYPLPVIFTSDEYSVAGAKYAIKSRFSSEFRGYISGINVEKVFLLKNDKNCLYSENSKITEYWIISENSDFPEFVEIGKLTDYKALGEDPTDKYNRESIVDSFNLKKEFSPENIKENVLLTPLNYPTFKNDFLKSLKEDKLSFVIIEYPDYGKTKKTIFEQSVQLKKFLTKNYIRENRIIVKTCKWFNCEFDFDSKFPIYPKISIVHRN